MPTQKLPIELRVWTPIPQTGMEILVISQMEAWIVRHMREDGMVLTECFLPPHAPHMMAIPQDAMHWEFIYEQIYLEWRQPDPWTFESEWEVIAHYVPTRPAESPPPTETVPR